MMLNAESLLNRPVGPEVAKTMKSRLESGFFERYLSGPNILDIGYRGANPNNQPVVPHAIGIERDYPGYDGTVLPFPSYSQDAVHSSHCLEHIPDPGPILRDWFRVLRIGGYLVLTVPHQQLYERKPTPTSRWGGNEHLRFYTPARLLTELETALPVGEFRVRSLRDNDDGFNYETPPDQYAHGCYEIEVVLQRIARPAYAVCLRLSEQAQTAITLYREKVQDLLRMDDAGQAIDNAALEMFGKSLPIPPYQVLRPMFPSTSDQQLRRLLWPLVDSSVVDAKFYIELHPDVQRDVGTNADLALQHYRRAGYFEGKCPTLKLGFYG